MKLVPPTYRIAAHGGLLGNQTSGYATSGFKPRNEFAFPMNSPTASKLAARRAMLKRLMPSTFRPLWPLKAGPDARRKR